MADSNKIKILVLKKIRLSTRNSKIKNIIWIYCVNNQYSNKKTGIIIERTKTKIKKSCGTELRIKAIKYEEIKRMVA